MIVPFMSKCNSIDLFAGNHCVNNKPEQNRYIM